MGARSKKRKFCINGKTLLILYLFFLKTLWIAIKMKSKVFVSGNIKTGEQFLHCKACQCKLPVDERVESVFEAAKNAGWSSIIDENEEVKTHRKISGLVCPLCSKLLQGTWDSKKAYRGGNGAVVGVPKALKGKQIIVITPEKRED
jgi:hypothetical protein